MGVASYSVNDKRANCEPAGPLALRSARDTRRARLRLGVFMVLVLTVDSDFNAHVECHHAPCRNVLWSSATPMHAKCAWCVGGVKGNANSRLRVARAALPPQPTVNYQSTRIPCHHAR